MINNLRSIGAVGAVYVAVAAVGTAQAAGPDDRAEARGPGAIGAAAALTGNTPPWLRALNERSGSHAAAHPPTTRLSPIARAASPPRSRGAL